MSKVYEAGIHTDLPMSEYIADPCPEPSLSKGVVRALTSRHPALAWLEHPRLGGEDSGSKEADLGSAAHGRLLGDDDRIAFCDATYASGPRKSQIVTDWTSRDGRRFQDDCRATGKVPLLAHQEEQLDAMVAKARPVLDQFGPGKCEQTLIWQDDGVWCKSRPDWLSEDRLVAVDYKTTACADPHYWASHTLFSSGYDVQAALCLRGLDLLLSGGEIQREFYFLVQEKDPPYEPSLVRASPEVEAFGMRKILRALPVWRECLATNNWPGYMHTTKATAYNADVPTWAAWEQEAREILADGGV